MNPHIDLDGTLKRWPAPTRVESFWEERAHAIVRAALTENKTTKTSDILDALMRAPPLPGEPGEPSAPRAGSAAGPRSKRASLREMAERHSSRVGSLKQQEEAAAELRAVSQPADDDGGIMAATPALAAAEPVGPTAPRAAVIALPAKKKGTGGVIAGAAIAVMGIAAAFAIVQRDRVAPPGAPPASARVEAQPERAAEPPPPNQAAPLPDKAPPVIVAEAEIPSARPSTPSATSAPTAAVKAPPADIAPTLPTASPAPEIAQGPSTAPPKVIPGQPDPGPPKPPGGINGEDPDDPPPASSNDNAIPQEPAPGAISAAFAPFMRTARKCVADATEPSRASITFVSDGSVKSITVTGWAASNGATGCITSAFMGANVGKFWKPVFTVNKTITP